MFDSKSRQKAKWRRQGFGATNESAAQDQESAAREGGSGADCVACSYVWSRGSNLRQQIAKSKRLRSGQEVRKISE